LHMLLVDMRGFEGVGDPDSSHFLQIAYGTEDPRVTFKEYHPETGEPILGLFSPKNTRSAAVTARERLHYLGFVSEETFARGELLKACRYFRNDHLLKTSEIETYPLWER
jgi:hypothetical protein